MTGLDTNVLVRFFARDDIEQADKAEVLFRNFTVESPGYISLVTLVETVWVLQRRYGVTRTQLFPILERLMASSVIVLESLEIVNSAYSLFSQTTANFADCLIERSSYFAGCEKTVTFDAKAAKTTGMKLLS
jgi:predicted nucleic-acid-binding protein